MQMLSLKTKDIIVSVFYDMSGALVPSAMEKQKLNILIHSLKTAFERKYLSELMENRAKSNNDSVHESQSVSLLPSIFIFQSTQLMLCILVDHVQFGEQQCGQ